MSEDTKADLDQVLELAANGSVPVQSYQKTSTSGKPFTVSAATRGAPGPKNGITNPGGGLRSGVSSGRLANEAGRAVAQSMGSGNAVTVGSSGIGRSPLSPYTASSVPSPPHTAGALAAAANAATAGAQLQATAIANQAASAAAQAAKVAAAKKAPYNFITYPKTAKTPYNYTSYPKSSSSGSSSSSSSSKAASGMAVAAMGLRAASLAHSGLAGGGGGNHMGNALRYLTQRRQGNNNNTADQAARERESQKAHDTASLHAHETASRHAHETASLHAHETASRDARRTASEHARETASRDAHRAGGEVTSLTTAQIIELQILLSGKGYPVKVDGRLCNEFITIAEAYFKAAK